MANSVLRNSSILGNLRAEYGFPSCRSTGFSCHLEQYAFEIVQLLFTTRMIYQALDTGEGKVFSLCK